MYPSDDSERKKWNDLFNTPDPLPPFVLSEEDKTLLHCWNIKF